MRHLQKFQTQRGVRRKAAPSFDVVLDPAMRQRAGAGQNAG